MKKIILFPLALCAGLICGCQRSPDTAVTVKVDALTQKFDVLLQSQFLIASNQVSLFNELESVKVQIAALPRASDLTNALEIVRGRFDKLDGQASAQSVMSSLLLSSVDIILTNQPASTQRETAGQTVNQIEMQSNVEQTKEDVDNIQEDLRKIKAKLGILF